VQVEILFLLKLISFESLAGNDFFERGTQAAKETMIASVEVLDVIYRIAVQGIFEGIVIKSIAASL